MAAIAVSVVAKAVTTITCVCARAALTPSSTSRPVPPAILRSVMTTSKSRAPYSAAAAAGDSTTVDLVAGAGERDAQELAHRALVVDDEDGSGRAAPPSSVSALLGGHDHEAAEVTQQRRAQAARVSATANGVADERHIVHRRERREHAHAAHVDDAQDGGK